MKKTWALPLAMLLLAGCGQSQPVGLVSNPAVRTFGGQLIAQDDSNPSLADFLKGDPTFTGTGTQNAYKASSASFSGKNFVQMWYRDLTGYFGNATQIEADYGNNTPGHGHFQTFTLTQLRPGFYQMDQAAQVDSLDNPAVAFHAGNKWDSNLGKNYAIHFQPFPTQPW